MNMIWLTPYFMLQAFLVDMHTKYVKDELIFIIKTT